jgi:hypothetical protein
METKSVWRWTGQETKLSPVPPRNRDDHSLEDAILDIAAAGRKKDVSPCMLVEDPAFPAIQIPSSVPTRAKKAKRCPLRSWCQASLPMMAIGRLSADGSP